MRVGEPQPLGPTEFGRPERRRSDDASTLGDDAVQLPDEPGVDAGPLDDRVDPGATTQCRLELEDPLGGGDGDAPEKFLHGELLERGLGRVGVEPGAALLQASAAPSAAIRRTCGRWP